MVNKKFKTSSENLGNKIYDSSHVKHDSFSKIS